MARGIDVKNTLLPSNNKICIELKVKPNHQPPINNNQTTTHNSSHIIAQINPGAALGIRLRTLFNIHSHP
jgi:hypothetical protein